MTSNEDRVRHFINALPQNILHPQVSNEDSCLINAETVQVDFSSFRLRDLRGLALAPRQIGAKSLSSLLLEQPTNAYTYRAYGKPLLFDWKAENVFHPNFR